jgi:hypothetical protein
METHGHLMPMCFFIWNQGDGSRASEA